MVKYRALFISDVHLGTKECKADRLLAFLAGIEAETIYLIGDIIDGWRLLSTWYLPQTHTDVIREFMDRAQVCRVIYTPGNHDEFMRRYIGETICGVHIVAQCEHVAADGRVYLVSHGDEVDSVYTHTPRLARLFSWCEGTINNLLGVKRLSLWPRLKTFYRMRRHVANFEALMLDSLTVDGVICGHIHHAAIRRSGLVYANCGSWTEDNCTAIVEHFDGRLELLEG